MTTFSIAAAAEALQEGRVIAYPTEAVYGLGCDPAQSEAVMALLAMKQRSPDKGLILIAHTPDAFAGYIADGVPEEAWQRARLSWPGPATWVFPAKAAVPSCLRGTHSSIALRVSNHPIVQELCSAFGGCIVSTSANVASQPPCKDAAEIDASFPKIAGIVSGPLGNLSRPTVVRDVLTGHLIRG